MLERVRNAVRDTINALTWIHKAAEVTTGLLIPVLVGLLATFQDKLLVDAPIVFWALVAALTIAAIVLTALSLGVKSAPEVYLDWQTEKEANERIAKDIQYCTLLESESLAMSGLVRGYAAARITTRDALRDAVSDICGGFVEERMAYFGFEYREKWNFAVYLWNADTNRLEPIWRAKAKNHPSQGIGRTWGDNEGHIGHAFHNRTPIITTDGQAQQVAALMGAGNNVQPYDAETYRSYVSEPILGVNPADVPHGVLVATSDKVGRYDPANSRVLKHAAVALATLIETAYDSP